MLLGTTKGVNLPVAPLVMGCHKVRTGKNLLATLDPRPPVRAFTLTISVGFDLACVVLCRAVSERRGGYRVVHQKPLSSVPL